MKRPGFPDLFSAASLYVTSDVLKDEFILFRNRGVRTSAWRGNIDCGAPVVTVSWRTSAVTNGFRSNALWGLTNSRLLISITFRNFKAASLGIVVGAHHRIRASVCRQSGDFGILCFLSILKGMCESTGLLNTFSTNIVICFGVGFRGSFVVNTFVFSAGHRWLTFCRCTILIGANRLRQWGRRRSTTLSTTSPIAKSDKPPLTIGAAVATSASSHIRRRRFFVGRRSRLSHWRIRLQGASSA